MSGKKATIIIDDANDDDFILNFIANAVNLIIDGLI